MFSRFASWTSTTTSLSTFNLGSLVPLYLLLFFSSLRATNAFTWRFTSAPTQCQETSVIWDGGTAPYKLLMLPLGFEPQGVETRVIFERTIDSGNQEGFIFPFPAGSDFVAVMSDATGFGTGGTSPILTVDSSNSSSCLPATPSEPEFYLYLSSTTLNQCAPVHISWDRPASPPVTVYGIIPQGQSFDLNAASHVGSSGTGFDWTVNIKSGTPFFFVAGDRNGGGKGGSTDVQSIGSGSSRCVDGNSPSVTADSGVGSVGQLPNGSGAPTPTPTGGSNDPSGSGNNNGSGTGNGNNTGDDNGDGNGNGNGNGNQTGGNDDGSGGGTVHGPLDPTSTAGVNGAAHKGPNLPLILGLVITLTGLGLLIGLAVLFYKRRKREQDRRDNQRARLLPTGDVSEVHLPRDHADLPHPRPPFSTRAWPGGSIENLGSALRATPFIWPMGGRDSSSPRDRDPGVTGTSTARPGIESRSTSSSGMLRRLRSNRFPFGPGSGGYQSLGDDSTPSSNLQNTNTTNNSSGFGSALATGHNTSYSNESSASAVHKSPLPASYLQHVSQNSHGSDGSRLGHVSPTRMSSDNAQADFSPLMSGGQHTLTRPGPAPLGPRPAPGSSRPSFGRLDTGGSVWEVPPTYDSLRRQQARGS